jgi:hypothetical protein
MGALKFITETQGKNLHIQRTNSCKRTTTNINNKTRPSPVLKPHATKIKMKKR